MGCDRSHGCDRTAARKFLLTHPVWDVTAKKDSLSGILKISTHTSRVGCDTVGAGVKFMRMVFLLTHPVWDVTRLAESI